MSEPKNSVSRVDHQPLVVPLDLWLQWHGDGTPEDDGEVCESEVTWSSERIFTHDIEYVSKAALQDPVRTHAMMLRGEIAWESEKIRHLLGDGDLLDMLYRCEAWFSTLPEGRKMQLECQRVISLHNAKCAGTAPEGEAGQHPKS